MALAVWLCYWQTATQKCRQSTVRQRLLGPGEPKEPALQQGVEEEIRVSADLTLLGFGCLHCTLAIIGVEEDTVMSIVKRASVVSRVSGIAKVNNKGPKLISAESDSSPKTEDGNRTGR